MNTQAQLSPDWRRWISENLARGCDPQMLIADMVRKDFDPGQARAAVLELSKVLPRSAADPAPNNVYVYETPRFARSNIIAAVDRDVRVTMYIERPVIALLDNLLSHDECDELVRRSIHKLKRSTIVDPTRGSHEVIPDRSSDGTFFAVNADPFIERLDRRIAAVMNWPLQNGEGLQILRYQTGGQYTPHFDYFPPNDPGSKVHMENGGQRVSSLIIYLNDVEDGGSTVFPELNLTVGPKKAPPCISNTAMAAAKSIHSPCMAACRYSKVKNGSRPNGCARVVTANHRHRQQHEKARPTWRSTGLAVV